MMQIHKIKMYSKRCKYSTKCISLFGVSYISTMNIHNAFGFCFQGRVCLQSKQGATWAEKEYIVMISNSEFSIFIDFQCLYIPLTHSQSYAPSTHWCSSAKQAHNVLPGEGSPGETFVHLPRGSASAARRDLTQTYTSEIIGIHSCGFRPWDQIQKGGLDSAAACATEPAPSQTWSVLPAPIWHPPSTKLPGSA